MTTTSRQERNSSAPTPGSSDVTIFDDLRASHTVQRALARRMTHARVSPSDRRTAYLALAHELDAHATSEERHLYVPLLMDDAGLWVSRHALADHHKAEKLVRELRGVDPTTVRFSELAKQLSAEVRDHLDEEEHGTFQLAGKLLSKTRQRELAARYRAEYARRGGPFTL
jgi:Fe-S-cluster formation regulator IscX/YfhJ